MKLESILITGDIKDARLEKTKSKLKKILKLKSKKEIIIYDATYYFVNYTDNKQIKYYCVDSVLSFVEKLEEIISKKEKNNSYTTYILCDAYAGFMFNSNNFSLIEKILQKKEQLNIEMFMTARHLDFVPEEFLKYFDKIEKLNEEFTSLSNIN